ncbi:MAG: hypothetical protein WEB13_11310 [Dehalococcoidia bacterium]
MFEAVRAGGGIETTRRAVALVRQALIEVETTSDMGAGPFERSGATCTRSLPRRIEA